MCRVMSSIDNFKVLQTGRNYVVVNASGDYENHSHFESYRGAVTCINLVKKKRVPKSGYLIKAAMRLTTDSDYRHHLERIGEKRLQKQKYTNARYKGR